MASTIPFSAVVNVVPSVLSAGGIAVDLNGLLLTQSSYAPSGAILSFANQAAVSAYFGATSTEASLAANYFNSYTTATRQPGNLLMTRYPLLAISGFMRGGSLAALTLAQLQALTPSTVAVTVGGTLFTSSSINLSAATSFSNAASIIQAAFTAPTFSVTFDSLTSSFILTTTATGATATVTYATTSTMATGIAWTQATGATLSQGAAAAVPATFMTAVLAQTQNWATFGTVWEAVLSDKQGFATWSNSNPARWLYVAQDTDVNILTANSTATFGNWLQTNQFVGTMPIYGTASLMAFAMGYAASLDFTRLNGRATLMGKSQSGLVASVTTSAQNTAVLSNGYNHYGFYGSNNPANNANWFSPGSVSGSWLWADTYLNQIWLNANLQLSLVKLLTSVSAVPYNAQGYGLVYSAALDPINAAIKFGAIRQGIVMSASQISQMQFALGFDASAAVTSNGFYLDIKPATAVVRAARTSPTMTLYYQDGEAIQQLTLASIAVQ